MYDKKLNIYSNCIYNLLSNYRRKNMKIKKRQQNITFVFVLNVKYALNYGY